MGNGSAGQSAWPCAIALGGHSICLIFQQRRRPTRCLYSRTHGRLADLCAFPAGFARAWTWHGVCGVLGIGHFGAHGFGSGGVGLGQAQSRFVLARHCRGDCGQYPGRVDFLGDGLLVQHNRAALPAFQTTPARLGLARAHRPQGLSAVLAACGGRSAVFGGWLAQAALAAMHALHGHRQIWPLPGADGAGHGFA